MASDFESSSDEGESAVTVADGDTAPPRPATASQQAVVDYLDDADDAEQSDERVQEPDDQALTHAAAGRWKRRLAYGLLPALVLVLALGVGYLKWEESSARVAVSPQSAAETVQAATDGAIAMLAYRSDTVDKDLPAAADRLTGPFRDDYLKLINEVVIPGAKEKHISTAVTVPAAASVSTSANHAEALIFVNQATTIGDGSPANSISSVRVILDRVGERWLISQFEPI